MPRSTNNWPHGTDLSHPNFSGISQRIRGEYESPLTEIPDLGQARLPKAAWMAIAIVAVLLIWRVFS